MAVKKIGKREMKKIMNAEVMAAVMELDKSLGLYERLWVLSPEERLSAKKPANFDELFAKRKKAFADNDWAYEPRLGWYYESRRKEIA